MTGVLDFVADLLTDVANETPQLDTHPAQHNALAELVEATLAGAFTAVTDYGAVGDGVTDDTAAVQAALTAAAGGTLSFAPNRTYLVGDTLLVSSNTTLLLAPTATLKLADGTVNTRLLTNADLTNGNVNIRISGGVFDGNRDTIAPDLSGSLTSTLFFERVTGLKIERVTVRDSALVGIQTNNGGDIEIVECWIDHPIKFGIFIGNDDLPVRDVRLVRNRVTASGRHGIVVDGGYGIENGHQAPPTLTHVLIDGNVVEDSSLSPDWEDVTTAAGAPIGSGGFGIDIEQGVWHVRCVNNTLKGNQNAGLMVAAGANYLGKYATPVRHIVLAHNVSTGGALEGIRVDQAQDVVLASNTATLNGRDGIFAQNCDGLALVGNDTALNANSGVKLSNCRRVTVSAGAVRSNGTLGQASAGDTTLRMADLTGLGWASGDALTLAGETGLHILGTPTSVTSPVWSITLSANLAAEHFIGQAVTNTTRSNAAQLREIAQIGTAILVVDDLGSLGWQSGDTITLPAVPADAGPFTLAAVPVKLDTRTRSWSVPLDRALVAAHAIGATVTNSTRSNTAALVSRPSYPGIYVEALSQSAIVVLAPVGWQAGDTLSIPGEASMTIAARVDNGDGSTKVTLSAALRTNHAAGASITNVTRSNAAALREKAWGLPTDGVLIAGNHCWDDQAAQTQAYGVFVLSNTADPRNVRIAGNDLRGNVNVGASWSSTAGVVAYDNLGFVTDGLGYGQIDPGATSLVVTHGLDRTPHAYEIRVTPTADAQLCGIKAWWVSATSGTTFTVSVDTTPTTGQPFTFQWQIQPRH